MTFTVGVRVAGWLQLERQLLPPTEQSPTEQSRKRQRTQVGGSDSNEDHYDSDTSDTGRQVHTPVVLEVECQLAPAPQVPLLPPCLRGYCSQQRRQQSRRTEHSILVVLQDLDGKQGGSEGWPDWKHALASNSAVDIPLTVAAARLQAGASASGVEPDPGPPVAWEYPSTVTERQQYAVFADLHAKG